MKTDIEICTLRSLYINLTTDSSNSMFSSDLQNNTEFMQQVQALRKLTNCIHQLLINLSTFPQNPISEISLKEKNWRNNFPRTVSEVRTEVGYPNWRLKCFHLDSNLHFPTWYSRWAYLIPWQTFQTKATPQIISK